MKTIFAFIAILTLCQDLKSQTQEGVIKNINEMTLNSVAEVPVVFSVGQKLCGQSNKCPAILLKDIIGTDAKGNKVNLSNLILVLEPNSNPALISASDASFALYFALNRSEIPSELSREIESISVGKLQYIELSGSIAKSSGKVYLGKLKVEYHFKSGAAKEDVEMLGITRFGEQIDLRSVK